MHTMRLMISGGGTGGHVYPALAVVEWLTRNRHAAADDFPVELTDLLWVGQRSGIEDGLVSGFDIPYAGISAAAIRGKKPWELARAMGILVQGWRQARRLVKDFKPDVLFVTGGYVCWPVTLAARQAGVPILIYLPDVAPGLAIKSLARFAAKVAVTTAQSEQYFRSGQAVVTGYPTRSALFSGDRTGARQRLGLLSGAPVLLVFGGSQGAHSINAALVANLPDILGRSQVVHVTGRRDIERVSAQRDLLPDDVKGRYHVYAYLDQEMVDALLAADLVVSRAGASTMGELPAVGVASILVPYPYAGAHQWRNADHLVDAGAAVALPDERLAEQLAPTVLDLLGDNERRGAMSRAARVLARPDAAANIARELEVLAG